MKCVVLLKEEHRVIEQMLMKLTEAAFESISSGKVAETRFMELLREIREFVYGIHITKERHFFNFIFKRGSREASGLLSGILNEQEKLRRFVKAMQRILPDAAKGEQISVRMLAENALAYSGLMREHIKMLDETVFGSAERVLTESDDNAVMTMFKAIDSSASVQNGTGASAVFE